MAYGNTGTATGTKSYAKTAAPAGVSKVGGKKEALFRTGLFAPTKEGVKSIGSVQVKEDITLPAGSFINLYENDKRTTDKHPMFTLTVTPGSVRAAQ